MLTPRLAARSPSIPIIRNSDIPRAKVPIAKANKPLFIRKSQKSAAKLEKIPQFPKHPHPASLTFKETAEAALVSPRRRHPPASHSCLQKRYRNQDRKPGTTVKNKNDLRTIKPSTVKKTVWLPRTNYFVIFSSSILLTPEFYLFLQAFGRRR